tara:strand:+ start:218 stop:334 length:117 start_codon:yes stop_codon:yes gene_type:complete
LKAVQKFRGIPNPIGFDNNYRCFDVVVWRKGKLGGDVK